MENLSYNELQERISILEEYALEEYTSSEGVFNKAKKLDKEIIRLIKLRFAMPEWKEFLKEVEADKKADATVELPY
jgi:hypothetical protein